MNLNIAIDRMTQKTLINKCVDPHRFRLARSDIQSEYQQLMASTKTTKPNQNITGGLQLGIVY
jgi:hypothetical protein